MLLLPLTTPGRPFPPYGLFIWKFKFGHSITDKSVVLLGTSWRTPWWEPLGNSMATHWSKKQKGKKVWCYWEHLGEHIDGNPLGTKWQHIGAWKKQKEKKSRVLLGTSWRTHWWELNGNTLEQDKRKKRKKCDVAIGNTFDNTLMGTQWQLNGNTLEQEKRKKKKKVRCCYWEHLRQHIDGNSMGTQWQHIGARKKKKVWCCYWEHLGQHIDENSLGTQWPKKKKKKTGPSRMHVEPSH